MPTLVVGPNWVGDMLMAHGLVATLKAREPAVPIHLIAPPWSLAVASRMPEVDHTQALPFAHGELNLRGRFRLAQTLKAEGYQAAYVLPNSLKSALIPWMAKIPRRIGWRGEGRFGLLTEHLRLDTSALPRMVDRYRALADLARSPLTADQLPPLDWPMLAIDAVNQARWLAAHGLAKEGFVALCPGAEFGPAKQWPLTAYAELARSLLARGQSVVLLGSAKDAAQVSTVVAAIPANLQSRLVNVAGQTALTDAIDLLAAAAVVVSNDSGLMHLASATGRRVVALFGPSSETQTPPVTGRAQILTHAVPCRPCFARVCPLGHQDCLTQISVAEVVAAIDRIH